MKKPSTSTPHDGLFKLFLTTSATAKDFFEIHLPESLRKLCDFSTLQLQSSSFLEEHLRPYYSDILYSIETQQGCGYIYALIEHQSSPDKHMGFRLMRYAIAAMQQHLDAGNDQLPLVIPLLFYHGQVSPYPYSLNWYDNFTDPVTAKTLYNQPFPLVDVTVIPDSDIMQHKGVALLELVQKHIRQRDLQDWVEQLVTLLLKGYTTKTQVKSLMQYILQVGETKDLNSLIMTLAVKVPEHEETLMTIAEQLRQEGRQKGRQEGRQEGQQQAKHEMARSMLLNGIERDVVMSVTGLSAETLSKLTH